MCKKGIYTDMLKTILIILSILLLSGCMNNQNILTKNKETNQSNLAENSYKRFIISKRNLIHLYWDDRINPKEVVYWDDRINPKEVDSFEEAEKYCKSLKEYDNHTWELPLLADIIANQNNSKVFSKSGYYFSKNNNHFYIKVDYPINKKYARCLINDSKDEFIFKPFEKISNIVNKKIQEYMYYNPIPPVKEPILPSMHKLEKDVFETRAMFEKRIEQVKIIREKQTKEILEKYRLEVEKHNKLVEKQKAELIYKKSKLPIMQRKYTIQAFQSVMKSPILEPLYLNSQPQYDAEKGLFYLSLKMKGAKYNKKVKVEVNAGKDAREFFKALQNDNYKLDVHYSFINNNELVLNKILVNVNGKNFKGTESKDKEYKAQKPMMIVLKDIKLDKSTLDKKFKLQNPNIKDVEFETYLVHEQKVFNDDISQLLSKTKQVPIDKSKWLFIIGIENYTQTDNISFSKRSAKLFKQVAKKTLGIQERNIYTLIDDGATSASIKDRMRLMLRNVKKGDKIYFYYSGHGIPVLPAREPYILPSDKIPDFVNDDKFFKVKNIYKILADSKASQVIVFMDSCFTGQTDGKSVFGTAKASSRLSPKSVSFDKSKMAIITAGTNNQYSNVYMKRGNRLFSYYLMKSLLEGRKNINTLYKEVSLKVEDASSKMGDMNLQQPVFSGNKNLKL